MRAPRFWHKPQNKAGFLPVILAPLGWIWACVGARKLTKGPRQKMPVPVICVGNINVGGTGKTPTVIALQSMLAAQGIDAQIVSRGYGGSECGPLKVDEQKHSAAQVGDEPLLMAAFGTVWVAKDRAAGAASVAKNGADVILLDDGLQNAALHYDLSIVVVDAVTGFGNGRVMPAGPLREKVKTGLARADLVISIGGDAAQKTLSGTWPEVNTLPRLNAVLKPLQTGMDWNDLKVIAFAGIGRPAKFFQTLRAEGAIIIAAHEFADHAEYSRQVLQRLKTEAQKQGAQLVTTEKDAARLPADFRSEVLALPVRLEIADLDKLTAALADIL